MKQHIRRVFLLRWDKEDGRSLSFSYVEWKASVTEIQKRGLSIISYGNKGVADSSECLMLKGSKMKPLTIMKRSF